MLSRLQHSFNTCVTYLLCIIHWVKLRSNYTVLEVNLIFIFQKLNNPLIASEA